MNEKKTTSQIKDIKLKDDFSLLDLMISDSQKQSDIYKPGPYWLKKTQNSINEIKRCGIKDFYPVLYDVQFIRNKPSLPVIERIANTIISKLSNLLFFNIDKIVFKIS